MMTHAMMVQQPHNTPQQEHDDGWVRPGGNQSIVQMLMAQMDQMQVAQHLREVETQALKQEVTRELLKKQKELHHLEQKLQKQEERIQQLLKIVQKQKRRKCPKCGKSSDGSATPPESGSSNTEEDFVVVVSNHSQEEKAEVSLKEDAVEDGTEKEKEEATEVDRGTQKDEAETTEIAETTVSSPLKEETTNRLAHQASVGELPAETSEVLSETLAKEAPAQKEAPEGSKPRAMRHRESIGEPPALLPAVSAGSYAAENAADVPTTYTSAQSMSQDSKKLSMASSSSSQASMPPPTSMTSMDKTPITTNIKTVDDSSGASTYLPSEYRKQEKTVSPMTMYTTPHAEAAVPENSLLQSIPLTVLEEEEDGEEDGEWEEPPDGDLKPAATITPKKPPRTVTPHPGVPVTNKAIPEDESKAQSIPDEQEEDIGGMKQAPTNSQPESASSSVTSYPTSGNDDNVAETATTAAAIGVAVAPAVTNDEPQPDVKQYPPPEKNEAKAEPKNNGRKKKKVKSVRKRKETPHPVAKKEDDAAKMEKEEQDSEPQQQQEEEHDDFKSASKEDELQAAPVGGKIGIVPAGDIDNRLAFGQSLTVVPANVQVGGPPIVDPKEQITMGSEVAVSNNVVPTTNTQRLFIKPADDYSVGSTTVATSTYHEDRQSLVNHSMLDPHGESGKYTGVVLASTGMPHGLGKMVYDDDGRVYEGDWRHGMWHGFGKAVFANGDSYEGEYKFDQRHGRGFYQWKDGRQYDGEFSYDKRHGKGTFKWPDGSSYEGDFVQGQREGEGSYTFKDGGHYKGGWVDGFYEGYGECQWADGRYYRGEWKQGRAHGTGVEAFADGTIRHDGQWDNDEPVVDE